MGCGEPAEGAEDVGDEVIEPDDVVSDAMDAAEVDEPDLPLALPGCGVGELDPYARCDSEWADRISIVGLEPDDFGGFYVVFLREDQSVIVERFDARGERTAVFEGSAGKRLLLMGACSGGVCFLNDDEPRSLIRLLPDPDGKLVLHEPEPGSATFGGDGYTVRVDGAAEPTFLRVSTRAGTLALHECSFGLDAECALRSLPVECADGLWFSVRSARAWAGQILVSGECSTLCEFACDNFDSFVQPLGGTGEGWLPLGTFPDGTAPLLIRAPAPVGGGAERLWALTAFAPFGFSDDGGVGVTGFDLGSFDSNGTYTSVWRGPVLWGAPDPTQGLAVALPGGIHFLRFPEQLGLNGALQTLFVRNDGYPAVARTFQMYRDHRNGEVARFGDGFVLALRYPSTPTLVRFDADGRPIPW